MSLLTEKAKAARKRQQANKWTAATENGPLVDRLVEALEAAEKAVVAEREACAVEADDACGCSEGCDTHLHVARAIRARGDA